jgi:hypothetical protein
MHATLMRRGDGRAVCGNPGNLMCSLSLADVTCRACRCSLLVAMHEGRLNLDYDEWCRRWRTSLQWVEDRGAP